MSLKIRHVMLTCTLLGACSDDAPDARADSGAKDGGVDARSPSAAADSGVDARTATSATDARVDAQVDARAAACNEERAFLAAHQSCASDADCVIVGACSAGFGFVAVQQSAKVQAQSLSDHTSCGQTFDGPTYHPVCEEGVCRARFDGRGCGIAPNPDGGIVGCAGGEQYQLDCSAAGTPPSCEQRCSSAADSSCGAQRACKQVQVAAIGGDAVTGACRLIDAWLCQPAN